jgi:hypothetical protein
MINRYGRIEAQNELLSRQDTVYLL